MKYKIIFSYILSTLSLSLLTILLVLLLKLLGKGISIETTFSGFLKMFLFSVLVGLTIGIALILLGNKNENSWREILVSATICGGFLALFSVNFTSSLEGVWIWFLSIGIVYGVLVFLFKRMIFRLI
jgi:hypothetical protein